jgi:flagellar protein FliO/FliZ
MEGYSYMLLRSILALGLVAVLVAGAVYVLRVLSGRSGSAMGSAPVSVTSRAFIGQKSSIAIVDVAGEVLVLGVSPNAINLLLRIDDPETLKTLRLSPARGGLKGLGRLIKRTPVKVIKMEKGS